MEEEADSDDSDDEAASGGSGEEKSVQFEKSEWGIFDSDDDEDGEDGTGKKEEQSRGKDDRGEHELEFMIRSSFEDDEGMQEVLLELAWQGKIPEQAWDVNKNLQEWVDQKGYMQEMISKLERSGASDEKTEQKCLDL